MKNKKRRVAVLANLKQNAPELKQESPDIWDDLDSMKTINSLIESLNNNGYEAEFFEAQISPPYKVTDRIEEYEPDICFNIAEGHCGVPGI